MSTPAQRIGDADRDRAIDLLREHHAAGRLDAAEFDERMSAALAARTSADLAPLFADLPADPQGAHLPATVNPPSPTQLAKRANGLPAWVTVLNGIAWPAALIFNFATDWKFWWVILIPTLLVPSLMGAFGNDDEDDEDDDQGESRQLEK